MMLILTLTGLWAGAKVPWKQIVMDIFNVLTNSL